ncbi:MAG: AMP-binding protein, partial [Ruminococcaceae bacterium]|nr:AMP-binding protein [Oscillospiraceae bacterium]
MQIIRGAQYFKVRPFTTLREMLDQSAALFADKVAFRFRNKPGEQPREVTYATYRTDIDALGQALCHLGLQQRRIAVVGDNSYAWCLAFSSIVCGAGTAVPLDRQLPVDEMTGLLQRSRAEVIFYDPAFHDALAAAGSELPALKILICLRPEQLESEKTNGFKDPRQLPAATPGEAFTQTAEDSRIWLSLTELMALGYDCLSHGDRQYQSQAIDADALMSLLFTSGTTSQAKAVMLSHRNVCADIQGIAGMVKLKPGIRMLSVLPLHHTFENTCGLFMALYVGAQVHEMDGLRYIQKNMQEYGIDMIIGVPLLFANFYAKIQSTLVKTGKEQLIRKMIPLTQGLRR